MLVAAVCLSHWWRRADKTRGSLDCHPRSIRIRAAEAKAVMGALWLRVLRAGSETHAQYRKLDALADRGEYVSSPRRIPVLGRSRDIRCSIWTGRCPWERDSGGVQTTHRLAGPCSVGSGGGADLGPHGTSDTGLTEHQVIPHADGNSAAGPANGHTQDFMDPPAPAAGRHRANSGRLMGPYGRTSSMIFPMCALDSIKRCASAASASGNTR